MDSNEVAVEGSGFSKFIEEVGLVDAIKECKPELETDSTYLWGPNRLDYALVSPRIIGTIADVGHHPFHKSLVSDHKFYADQLFDSGLADLMDYNQR